MWDESVFDRGVNEMASCFLKWIETLNLPPTLKTITIWSDNCPSQNRNGGMIMCYFYILHKFPQLEVINHKFLLIHLEADSSHSLMERQWRKETQFKIMTPWDWHQLVRMCNKKKPFVVIGMETEKFYNFKALYDGNNSPFVLRKKSTNGDPFLISNVVHLQMRSNKPGIVYYKTDFDQDFLEIDFNKNRRITNITNNALNLSQNTGNMITTQKYNHLQKLLKWVPNIFHLFYKNLKHTARVQEDNNDQASLFSYFFIFFVEFSACYVQLVFI